MRNRFAGALAVALLVSAALVSFSAFVRAAEDDIGGVVTSANGPEEGVWVIAETTGLPTKFVKSVVTGDGGRYLIPDLPNATYDVWVRGYGLVDSAPVQASPGDTVDLAATVAATPAEAAAVYPANYWYSLIRPPAQDEFPGTGDDGNGISANLQHQDQWIDVQKQGCMLCHQLGNRIVREIDNLEQFDSSLEAWNHRVQMGQRGGQMTNVMNRFGRTRGLQMFSQLERPHRRRRGARGAAASAGRRAERRRLDVGVGHRHRLHPRRDRHRQAQPRDQRERPRLRGQHLERRADHPRPGHQRGDEPRRAAPGRSGHGAGHDRDVDARPLALLRRRADLERPRQPPQPDDGPEGAGLDDLGHPATGPTPTTAARARTTRSPATSRSTTGSARPSTTSPTPASS